ncbi:MAG: hypothetical protein H0X24_25020 [Ktedonobacterales bacterium]|nr:hypothetical protein [Ktedonobacterales bacterium]
MQRCGQCGFELTDAAIKMGYCPNCGSVLRVDGAPQPQSHVTESPYPSPSGSGYGPPPALASGAPVASGEAQPLAPALLPVAPPATEGTPSPGVPEGLNVKMRGAPSSVASDVPAPPAAPASPPSQVIIQRRGGAGAGIAIALLVLVLAAGGVLYAFGSNGVGPLAQFVHGTAKTSVAVNPTTLPTATVAATSLPTATTVPPTATPQPTVPPAPPNFTLFKAADGSYGLNVPANWTQSAVTATGITGTNFRSALTSQDFVQIDQGATSTFDPTKVADYVRNFAASSNGTSIVMTQSATTTTLGSNTWMSASATYLANGAQHKVVGLAITHGDSTYLVFYDALASAFADDPGTTYDTMVKSFTFLA